MTDPGDDLTKLITKVAELVDEIKLLSLNLTIGNAKLRLTDNAFQAVAGSFRELLDIAADGAEEAEVALKRARGDLLTSEEKRRSQKELDSSLDKIKKGAEHIIQTVISIKKGQKINRQY